MALLWYEVLAGTFNSWDETQDKMIIFMLKSVKIIKMGDI